MQSSTGDGFAGLLLIGIFAVIGLAYFIAWVWSLIHAITNRGLSDGEKVLWVLLLIFLPFLGMILYFVLGRPKKPFD